MSEEMAEMIKDIADNGGEYSFKMIDGQIQDVHYTEDRCLTSERPS